MNLFRGRRQFPDDKSPRDALVVGCICATVSLPFAVVLFEVFAMASEVEYPELQLAWPGKLRLLSFKQRWNWKDTRPSAVKVMAARFVHEGFFKIGFEIWKLRVCRGPVPNFDPSP